MIKKHFEPLFRTRLALVQKYSKDDPAHDEPQDHLQMMMRFAQKERPEELNLDKMTNRLMVANFGSMHQTSIQVTNMLLNILGSDGEYNTITVLRDEIKRVLDSDDGVGSATWSKAKIAKMTRADSVSRETLRLGAFGGRAVFRKIMVDGVTTDAGVSLPKGSMISFLAQPIHTDATKMDDPFKYDPFRFSSVREAAAEGDKAAGGSLSFVTTSPDHLPIGHGRHACPGRFLIDFELKMIIAYVLTHYDIKFPTKYNGKRPENRWLTEAVLPPAGARILVRRRTAETGA